MPMSRDDYHRYFEFNERTGRDRPRGSYFFESNPGHEGYDAFRDALLREAARHMGVPKDEMEKDAKMGRDPDEIKFNFDKSKHPKMKEINPQDRWKPDRGDRENEVTVWSSGPETARNEVYVHTGRRGRIGDIRIYGPDGRPENIGPTYEGPGQWTSPQDALRHFKRVQDAFDKLNRGELR